MHRHDNPALLPAARQLPMSFARLTASACHDASFPSSVLTPLLAILISAHTAGTRPLMLPWPYLPSSVRCPIPSLLPCYFFHLTLSQAEPLLLAKISQPHPIPFRFLAHRASSLTTPSIFLATHPSISPAKLGRIDPLH